MPAIVGHGSTAAATAPQSGRPARVLYVGVGRPWTGGAGFLVRQNVFLNALGDVAGELHLALFDADGATDAPPPPPFVTSVTALPRPHRRPASRLRSFVADFTSPLPRSVRDHDPAGPRAAVAQLRPESFDAVFAYRLDYAHFAGVLGHPRLILDIDDPEHVRWTRRLSLVASLAAPSSAAASGPDGRTRRDLCKLRDFELATEAHAKLAFVCQANDAGGWPVRPEVALNTVDLPAAPARRVGRPIVLFVGNCRGTDRTPNVDGVRHFVNDVWPLVRRAVPGAEFHLVGAAGDTVRSIVARCPGGVLRGFVDDLSAAYAEAAVSVAPIRFGTGTRVKILDAFAHACPVVSTAMGAEGIAAVPGREIELAVAADDFAARCVDLLTDPVTAERIGAAGRALAERVYDAAAERRRLAGRLGQFLTERPS